MTALFILGLWGILRFGTRLQAPPFVGGRWVEQTDGATRTPLLLNVAQSGVFLQLQTGDALTVQYKLHELTRDELTINATLRADDLPAIRLMLEANPAVLRLDPLEGRAVMFVREEGPVSKP